MKAAHTSPRITGNKTQKKPPSVTVTRTAARGDLPASRLKHGHHKLATIPVITPPTTDPNNP